MQRAGCLKSKLPPHVSGKSPALRNVDTSLMRKKTSNSNVYPLHALRWLVSLKDYLQKPSHQANKYKLVDPSSSNDNCFAFMLIGLADIWVLLLHIHAMIGGQFLTHAWPQGFELLSSPAVVHADSVPNFCRWLLLLKLDIDGIAA